MQGHADPQTTTVLLRAFSSDSWMNRKVLTPFWRNALLPAFKFIKNLLLTFLQLATWAFCGLTLYALIYLLIARLTGVPFPFQDLLGHLRRALQGEAKESAALLVAFVTALLGFGAQQWLVWVREERREKKQETLKELEKLADSLRDKRYRSAFRLYWEFRGRCETEWKDIEGDRYLALTWREGAPPPLRCWTDLCQQTQGPALSIEVLEALVWAWRMDREKRDLVQQRLNQVIIPPQLPVLESLVEDDPKGLPLLRSEAVRKQLDALTVESLPEDHWESLERLRTWCSVPIRLPSLWARVERPAEPEKVRESLSAFGLSDNPFGPERAELDPWLEDYGAWPASLELARGPRPALIFGAPGSGRTAAAHLLFRDCVSPPANPKEPGVFPIHLSGVETWPQTSNDWLRVLAREMTEVLLRLCADDPYGLFEHKAGPAIAQLIGSSLGSMEAVEADLRRAGLSGEALDYVLGEIREAGFGDYRELDSTTLLDLLGRARPAYAKHTYILMDVPGISPETDHAKKAVSLAALISLASPLLSRGVYLKLFLPEEMRSDLEPLWPEEPLSLTWTEAELREMLEQRLQKVGLQTLNAIVSAADYPPDPDTWLIRSAEGNPRKLVRLGNQMIRAAARRASS